ncbi:MAG: hypothetical protein HY964_02305 [Ignavibacteriales bacterium]|nr:hypothetical protein [Ignavibacteriales bacterium]
MTSHTNDQFWKAFQKLPDDVQEKARKVYQMWSDDPFHPSLKFKRIHPEQPIYSVRIGLGWRAVGVKSEDIMIWFWIGSHEEYNKLISEIH